MARKTKRKSDKDTLLEMLIWYLVSMVIVLLTVKFLPHNGRETEMDANINRVLTGAAFIPYINVLPAMAILAFGIVFVLGSLAFYIGGLF